MKVAIAPGALLAVLSGLILTFQLSGSDLVGFSIWLMIMQGAGLVAALLTLLIALPTASKLSRLDPQWRDRPLLRRAAPAAADCRIDFGNARPGRPVRGGDAGLSTVFSPLRRPAGLGTPHISLPAPYRSAPPVP